MKAMIFTILYLISIIQVDDVVSAPQYDYAVYNRFQRRSDNFYSPSSNGRRNSGPTRHPNSHYSRLLDSDYSRFSSSQQKGFRNSKRIDPEEVRGKTLYHHHSPQHVNSLLNSVHSVHSHHHGQPYYNPQAQSSPCYYRSRRNQESGRTLWDINYYNVYPDGRPVRSDCNDLYYDQGVAPQSTNLLTNFVGLLGGGGRPPPQKYQRPYRPAPQQYRPIPVAVPVPVSGGGGVGLNPLNGGGSFTTNTGGGGDIYDPVYENQYADPVNQGPNLTPGQIVGGIADTINGVIQALSGNSQSRSESFLSRIYSSMGGLGDYFDV